MKPHNTFTAWPKFSAFDTEARTREGESFGLDVCCVCHTDEFGNRKAFRTVSDYMDWVFSYEYKGEMVWSHWGGRYDQRFIIWEAVMRDWTWQAMVSGNLVIILILRDKSGRQIKFCDSSRLMPDSVAKIGETITKNRLKEGHEPLLKFKVDRTVIDQMSWEEVQAYCYRDCDIVLEGLKMMRTVFLQAGCDFSFTLASIATKYVRRSDVLNMYRFYEKDPETGKMVYSREMKLADKFAEQAFAGGLTAVFRQGIFEEELYYYDITSSYPDSMTKELPSYFKGFEPPLKSLEKSLARCGISEATVTIPQRAFYLPPLPVRDGEKLKFPWGHFRGRWTNIELQYLWERGKDKGVKIELHGQAVYEPRTFLEPFVRTFMKLRQEAIDEGDEFKSYAMKIFLNSLYGKLNENSLRRSVLFGEIADDAIEMFYDKVITNDMEMVDRIVAQGKELKQAIQATETPGVYYLNTVEDGPFRHVAAGAYVTARSRLRLIEEINKHTALGVKVLYSDTDSLIVDKAIFPNVGKKLGEFYLEHVISNAEIYSSKVYKITTVKGDVHYRAKGINIQVSENLTEDECIAKSITFVAHKAMIAAECEERWLDFTSKLKGLVRPPVMKAGIRGFKTDIAAGSVEPKSFELKRQMINGDLKRLHGKDGDSEAPWFTNLTNLTNVADLGARNKVAK